MSVVPVSFSCFNYNFNHPWSSICLCSKIIIFFLSQSTETMSLYYYFSLLICATLLLTHSATSSVSSAVPKTPPSHGISWNGLLHPKPHLISFASCPLLITRVFADSFRFGLATPTCRGTEQFSTTHSSGTSQSPFFPCPVPNNLHQMSFPACGRLRPLLSGLQIPTRREMQERGAQSPVTCLPLALLPYYLWQAHPGELALLCHPATLQSHGVTPALRQQIGSMHLFCHTASSPQAAAEHTRLSCEGPMCCSVPEVTSSPVKALPGARDTLMLTTGTARHRAQRCPSDCCCLAAGGGSSFLTKLILR